MLRGTMGMLFVVLLSMAHTTPASACSCVGRVLRRAFSPPDGARAVPTDAQVRLFFEGFDPAVRKLVATNETRLRVAGGALVPVRVQHVATRSDLVPQKRLRPNTRYVVEQLVAYDGKGQRLDDTARSGRPFARSASAPQIYTAWFEVSSFTTGAGTANATLPTPAPTDSALGFSQGGGDCGPGSSLSVKLSGTPLPPLSSWELEVKGQGVVATAPRSADRIRASNTLCTRDRVDLAHHRSRLQARVIARGPAGGSKKSAWITPPVHGQPHRRTRSKGQGASVLLSRWRAVTHVATPKPARASPRNCPHGLEVTMSRVVAATGGSSTYDAIGSVGWFGGRAATVINGPKKRPYVIPIMGKPFGVGTGSSPRAWFDRHGAVVAATEWAAGGSHVVVSSVTNKSKVAWSRRFGGNGSHNNPRVVRHGTRTLIAWEAPGKPTYEDELCWEVLDDSGKTVSPTPRACVPTKEGYPALAAVGSSFWLAHHRRAGRGGHTELLMGTSGTKQARRLNLGTVRGGLDMAVVSEREVGIVAENRGDILWTTLAPDGSFHFPPKVISTGRRNRKPRITWGHGVFLVAWERYPERRTYAVAIDRFGSVSDATSVLSARDNSTVAVGSAPSDFVATTVVDRGSVRGTTLRCRKTPSPRAPDRIQVP